MQDRMLLVRVTRDCRPAIRAPHRRADAQRLPTHIQVEGHTDNVLISTSAFPSN